MDSKITIQDIIAGYIPVKLLYDHIRLVDPVKKRVEMNIHPQLDEEMQYNTTCFQFWNQNKVCENCISVRSYYAGETFVKIGYNGDKLFLITAVALVVDGNQRVLELVKDITGNGLLDVRGQDGDEIYQMVGEINDLIVRDMLTGTYNKRYAYERLPYEILESEKNSSGLSVIITSIDNLEIVKTSHGYVVGDHMIKEYIQILEQYSRSHLGVWLARFGESEFLMVLPGVSEREAELLCDVISQDLNGVEFNLKGKTSAIKVSFGVHTVNLEGKSVSAEDLVNYTDMSIVMARKKAKSNRINPWYDSFVDNFGLSSREREVAKLLLEGRTNEDISQMLFIGIPTVKKHISSIYLKTEVNSRSEFLALYQSYQNIH
ncbi:MAG: diguanylate cyclase [Methylocystaceae bacterium]